MGDGTKIEWSEATWNPLTGCEAVSPGCDNCYAARQASGRLSGTPAYRGLAVNGQFTGEVRLLPDRLDQPLRWRRPRLIFVNSMSDLFHRDVPVDFLNQIVQTMANAPQHVFQVLTKRPQRMADYLSDLVARSSTWWTYLEHVWWGTSIESDRYAFRADHLRATPAAVRWLSLEPLLGPLPSLDLTGIDWVVAGGESGPGARPMHPEWVRDIRDRCVAAGVPFFFKQWGEWAPGGHPTRDSRPVDLHGRWQHLDVDGSVMMHHAGKKAAGRVLDGRTWDEYPEAES